MTYVVESGVTYMKQDNKYIAFPGRDGDSIEVIYCYDLPILKELANVPADSWPRVDDGDENCIARDVTDIDYSSRRDDLDLDYHRKELIDSDNYIGGEIWDIEDDRNPEDPDRSVFSTES